MTLYTVTHNGKTYDVPADSPLTAAMLIGIREAPTYRIIESTLVEALNGTLVCITDNSTIVTVTRKEEAGNEQHDRH